MLSVVVILLGAFVLSGDRVCLHPPAIGADRCYVAPCKIEPNQTVSLLSAAQRRLQNEATSPRERPRRAALIGSTAPGATSQLSEQLPQELV